MENRGGSAHRSTRLRALLIPLVAGCLAATGCTTLVGRLGYDHLPTLATWRVDGYLGLTAEQRALASRRIESLHDWHRRTQLDDYVALLRDVQRHAAAGTIDEARIRRWRLEVFKRFEPIAERAAPAVAEVATTLEPAQLARMKDEIARDNDKLRREWMPGDRAARADARAKRYVERAEMFLGPLDAEQKRFARRMAAEAPETEEAWFEQRLARQQDLLATMERIRAERPDEATATRWMREHLMRYVQPRDLPGRPFPESSLAAGDAMSAALFARATPKQRDHLQRTLQEWIDLLESLKAAPQAKDAPPAKGAARERGAVPVAAN